MGTKRGRRFNRKRRKEMAITFEEFKKCDIRIGEIVSVEKVENADNLLKLEVNLGEKDPKTNLPAGRQVVSGIAKWYTLEDLTGKKLPFIVNLEPRKFKGVESQGMLMAVDGQDQPILLEPTGNTKVGDKIV